MKSLITGLLILMLMVGSMAFVHAKPKGKSFNCKDIGIQKIHNRKFKVKPRAQLPHVTRAARYQSHGV